MGNRPDSAVVLFDGTNLDNWRHVEGQPASWELADGAMSVTNGNIVSTEAFRDAFIHLEFRTPDMPEASGQAKGNSGVFLQGLYEIQVLDSYGLEVPGKGDCGAIYDQYAPLVNACKPPLQWQSYDVIFRSARLDESDQISEPPRVTVIQNDRVIQNNVELRGPTGYRTWMDNQPGQPGPLMLQDHGDAVSYRSIWLVHLPLSGSAAYEPNSRLHPIR